MAVPTAQEVILSFLAGLGDGGGDDEIGLDYTGPTTDTATQMMVLPIELAANENNQQFNLSTHFDSLLYVILVDTGNVGFKFAKVSGVSTSDKIKVAPGKFCVITETAAFTLYLDNLSAASASYGKIIAIGSSA